MSRLSAPPRRIAVLRPVAGLIAAAFSLHATAQSTRPVEPKAPEVQLPEVKAAPAAEEGFKKEASSTATRTETPLRDIPQFINVVPEALMRAQNNTSLQEALRNVPGITYAAGEGGTQANQVFYLRGFPAGGDIFVDGVRDLGEYNRDVFATDTVEVLKGPSALMFGRGSTGGLIQQVTKQPGLVDKQEIALTLGNFDTKRLVADGNFRLAGDNAVRLVALAENSGSFRFPQDVKRTGVAPSVRFGIGHPTDVTLSYYYLETEDVTDYGQPSLSPAVTGTGFFEMPPISPERYYGYANHDYANHTTHIATAKVEHRVNRDVTIRNVLRYANYRRSVEATIATLLGTDRLGRPVTTATPLEDLMVRRAHDSGRTRDNDDDAIVNQTDVTWKLATGGVKHTVLGGLELAREKLNRWNFALDAAPGTPGVQAPVTNTPLLDPDPSTALAYTKTPNIRARATGETVAAFVQDQMELSERWKALVGARFERYEAEARTENLQTGAVASGPFSRTDNTWSGRAGLIYQPTAAHSYYVSAGNSHNPSGELGVYGQNGTNLNPQNEDLGPEKNVGYEVGGTWDLPAGLQVRAALFRNEKTNARKLDEEGFTVLTGRRRVQGLELQLAGHLAPNWEIFSGIAFMDGEIVSGPENIQGKTPLGVAKFAGNVWTTYRLGGGWEVGGGVRATSDYWLNDANTGKVPSATLVDLTAAYVRENYEVRLNLNNATGKTWYAGGYQNSPNRVLPGAPRQVQVTFRYLF